MERLLAEPNSLPNAQRPLPMALEKRVHLFNELCVPQEPHKPISLHIAHLTSDIFHPTPRQRTSEGELKPSFPAKNTGPGQPNA